MLGVASLAAQGAQGKSRWVSVDGRGRLQYTADARGNRIMDFSHAGYKGGGVKIPDGSDVAVARTVKAVAGDNTANIQAAIDEVSKLPAEANGFRGAVLLERGTYEVAGHLQDRRERCRAARQRIRREGNNPSRHRRAASGVRHWRHGRVAAGRRRRANVTDAYVPAGASTVTVDSAAGLRAGRSRSLIQRQATEAWIRFMGMDTLTRNGKPQTWLKAGHGHHARSDDQIR